MWMRILILSVAQLSTWAFSPIAFAQQDGDVGGRGRGGRGTVAQASEQDGSEVKCFTVTRAHPTKLADYIGQLYGRGRVVDMPATGKLLFMGTPREIEQVAELLKELDIPDMDTGSEPELAIIPIQHRRANDVLSNIRQVFSGTSESILRLSADDARSSIIVLSRSNKVLAAVKTIVEKLDRPAERVALEFVFFHADLKSADEKPVMPEDLQEVANELSRFGRVKLLGRLFADATEGGKFKVEGRVADTVSVNVQGRVQDAAKGEPVRLEVEANVRIEQVTTVPSVTSGFSTSRATGTFELKTEIVLTPGQCIVVGGSPAGLAEGQSVMLAVRATP
ncbi:MAG: hypothetical protein HS101_14105 [Planctomycetia bacterium]|jgi:type II secretory pathway component GspD/PulD (secretin)|nr:hypothetical protein [Planctomycetia bacterium]MCC7314639.1 hypothetical protein [Planctomycetota bacterium]OQZ01611.1 MAG: hypothetical protein B6D36_14030 [Planctomycetes bacterium UTPLA1]